MPVPAIVSAIVSSVVSAITDAPPAQPPVPTYESALRSFPADAKKGELVPPVLNPVDISGNKLTAAPGLQIRNQQNMIVMPSTLQDTAPVRYQLDPMGNVWRIWLLSAAEASASDPKQ